jgi:hypothetical protein
MTPEAAAELARLDTPGLRRRVERNAARLHADAIRFLSGRRIPPLCAWLRSAGGVIRSCSFDVVSGVDGQS